MDLRESSKKTWEKITRKKVHFVYIYVYPSSGDQIEKMGRARHVARMGESNQIEKNGEGRACSTYGGKQSN